MKDLLVLAADQDAEFLLKALLEKISIVEKISSIDFEIIRHPQRDAGVATDAVEFVRPYINDYRYLMIIFDYEGSGKETRTKNDIELDMENQLNINGWPDRCACITFFPELESWLWVHHQHLHDILDWFGNEDIYKWLETSGYVFTGNKPARPKESFEAALKKQKLPRSSSLYSSLAQKASYQQCIDPSFNKFLNTLKKWFIR
jgi:hypothetical protein